MEEQPNSEEDLFPWEEDQFVDCYDPDRDCGRCQGSGQVPTCDYESYFGEQYKPCPQCGGNGDR